MPRSLRKLLREGVRFAEATREYARPLAVARRYRHLYFERRFSPNEIRFFGLLDPSLTPVDLERVISKEELIAVQRHLNPSRAHGWTEDKLEFHGRCLQKRLKVPTLVAALTSRHYPGLLVPFVERAADFVAILDSLECDRLIVKPVRGVHGVGVTRLQRTADGWVDSNRIPFTAERFERMRETSGYDAWMLQELVIAHPELCRFSNTEALQTCRIVTFLDRQGNAEILAARIRLICGDTARDNFSYGTTGNVIANLDPVSGCIVSAVAGAGRDPRIVSVRTHPRTGRELIGFRVPAWAAAAQLALQAAKAFAPLRTIGWDVAIGPDGVFLIEGNVTWDTLSGEPRMGELYRRLVSECRQPRAKFEEAETTLSPRSCGYSSQEKNAGAA